MFSPPDCWDPPATSSHTRKCILILGKKDSPLTAGTRQVYFRTQGTASLSSLTAGTHTVKAYVSLCVLSRTCTYILVDRRSATINHGLVSSGTCHSRAPHVAVQAVPSKPCTCTCSHTPKNTATYVHTGEVSNAYSRICMTKSRVHGWFGTEKLHRRVHREATESAMFIRRQ